MLFHYINSVISLDKVLKQYKFAKNDDNDDAEEENSNEENIKENTDDKNEENSSNNEEENNDDPFTENEESENISSMDDSTLNKNNDISDEDNEELSEEENEETVNKYLDNLKDSFASVIQESNTFNSTYNTNHKKYINNIENLIKNTDVNIIKLKDIPTYQDFANLFNPLSIVINKLLNTKLDINVLMDNNKLVELFGQQILDDFRKIGIEIDSENNLFKPGDICDIVQDVDEISFIQSGWSVDTLNKVFDNLNSLDSKINAITKSTLTSLEDIDTSDIIKQQNKYIENLNSQISLIKEVNHSFISIKSIFGDIENSILDILVTFQH